MNYKRLSNVLIAVLATVGGCSDEFPAGETSSDGPYDVMLATAQAELLIEEVAELAFTVMHDDESVDGLSPELHYEQLEGGTTEGTIDVNPEGAGVYHAIHTFESAGKYLLTFSFMAESHEQHADEMMADEHADDQAGGDDHNEGHAGTGETEGLLEMFEHEFTIIIGDANDAAHTDDHGDDHAL